MNSKVLTEANAFLSGASYDVSTLNGTGTWVPFTPGTAGNSFSYNGMTIGYSGEGNNPFSPDHNEYLTLDETTEDLILLIVGGGNFTIDGSWSFMPESSSTGADESIAIETQQLAQQALDKISEAVVRKDKIRAHLGAMQNRLENTVSNLQIQAENLQAAESRISDVDVAIEMTEFVRSGILADAATAMLTQANTMPHIALQLIKGVGN
jgi:flagellin